MKLPRHALQKSFYAAILAASITIAITNERSTQKAFDVAGVFVVALITATIWQLKE